MSNELIFFITLAVNLTFILFAFRMGKEWLFAAIVGNMLINILVAGKLIPIFGVVASASAITYASIFLATDLLTEHHGKKEGYRSVWIAFAVTVLFVILGQLIMKFSSISDTLELSNSLQFVLKTAPRIAVAGLLAYLVAQNFDVWFYHFIHEKTGPRFLWLRNNLSTIVSQFIDSVIFFTLAFVGVVPFDILVQIVITGYLVKLIVALFDTPFIYLSYLIKGEKMAHKPTETD